MNLPTLNILLAPDKFKGSLTALEVGEALKRGLSKLLPAATITVFPLADGGEGTLEALTPSFELHDVEISAHDPLFQPVKAVYGYSEKRRLAVVEMARASGLQLLGGEECNCFFTSSTGTGELIKDALDRGATTVYLTVGGSATNEGGIGMASALGYRFLDEQGEAVIPIGENLKRIERIETTPSCDRLSGISFIVLTDVQNPLTGPHGASIIYGPQKGASPEQVVELDEGLAHLAGMIRRDLGVSVAEVPGSGAAGGMGAGAIAFLRASLEVGCESIMKHTGFFAALERADLVITGEGRIDKQTTYGKVVHTVASHALAAEKRTMAVAGQSTVDRETMSGMGISELFCLSDFAPVREAFSRARSLLETVISEAIAAKIRQIG